MARSAVRFGGRGLLFGSPRRVRLGQAIVASLCRVRGWRVRRCALGEGGCCLAAREGEQHNQAKSFHGGAVRGRGLLFGSPRRVRLGQAIVASLCHVRGWRVRRCALGEGGCCLAAREGFVWVKQLLLVFAMCAGGAFGGAVRGRGLLFGSPRRRAAQSGEVVSWRCALGEGGCCLAAREGFVWVKQLLLVFAVCAGGAFGGALWGKGAVVWQPAKGSFGSSNCC